MKKYKINLNPDKLTPQDLSNHMNFDKFSNNIPSRSNWLLKTVQSSKWKILAGTSGLAIGGYILFNTLNIFSASNSSLSPFINPPLKNVGIEYSTFSIDPARDTTLVYKTGSTINIPAYSFLDKDNKEVKDKVEIRYREFHDIYENILSGIPMEYDSASKEYTFESAGMLEFLPYKNGELLKINPKKPIVANLISYKAGDQFNTYYLDTTKRNWEYLGKNTLENGGNVLLFDSATAKQDVENYAALKAPVYPVKANPNRPNFTINYRKEEFPELALYDGVKFEIDAKEKKYNPKLSEKTWEDVYIKRKDESHYTITFSRKKESHSFAVVPVLEGTDYETSIKEFESKMTQYTSMMDGRKNDQSQQEAIIKSNYEKYIAQANWSNVNNRINNYLKNNPIRYNRLFMRTMEIQRAGIYNCDKPWPFDSENSLSVNINLFDQNNKPLTIKRSYMILKDRNLSRSNFYKTKDNQITNFRYNTNENFTLLIITKEGYSASINAKEFINSIKNSNKHNITMHVADQTIDNPKDLQTFLDM